MNSIPSVSGAGFDNVSISTVQISLQDTSIAAPNCYNPSINAFNVACPAFFGAKVSTTAWAFSFPVQPWTHAHHYVLISSATDLAGNVQSAISSTTFNYDIQAPTAAVIAPIVSGYLNPQQSLISGTATDSPAGVSSLQLALSSGAGLGSWLASVGGAFSQPSAVYFTTNSYTFGATDSWTWAPDTAALTDGQNYTLRVKSLDRAGNFQTQDFAFLYDATPAVATITFPVNGSFHTGALTFNGGSFDPLGPGGFASGVSTVTSP